MEYDTSAASGNERFDKMGCPLAENMTMLDDGGAVASGITAMAAFGHTPGHMAYRIESNGQQLVLGADFANHYVWSQAYPIGRSSLTATSPQPRKPAPVCLR